VELTAGTYEIYQLDGTSKRSLLIHMQPVRFEVRSGEIVYLGNLHVRYCLYKPDRNAWQEPEKTSLPTLETECRLKVKYLAEETPHRLIHIRG